MLSCQKTNTNIFAIPRFPKIQNSFFTAFQSTKSLNPIRKTQIDVAWEASNPNAYPGTEMYLYSCSIEPLASCGICNRKNTRDHSVTCSSGAQPAKAISTVCMFCQDDGNECCTTPTCDNIDSSGTAFSAANCPTGKSLKNSLSIVSCELKTCVEQDCCFIPLSADSRVVLKTAVDACLTETPDGSCPLFSNENGLIADYDVSKVTDMFQMFKSKESFNSDISKWDTSRVTRMKSSKVSVVLFFY